MVNDLYTLIRSALIRSSWASSPPFDSLPPSSPKESTRAWSAESAYQPTRPEDHSTLHRSNERKGKVSSIRSSINCINGEFDSSRVHQRKTNCEGDRMRVFFYRRCRRRHPSGWGVSCKVKVAIKIKFGGFSFVLRNDAERENFEFVKIRVWQCDLQSALERALNCEQTNVRVGK